MRSSKTEGTSETLKMNPEEYERRRAFTETMKTMNKSEFIENDTKKMILLLKMILRVSKARVIYLKRNKILKTFKPFFQFIFIKSCLNI
jgi:hypothetical protein